MGIGAFGIILMVGIIREGAGPLGEEYQTGAASQVHQALRTTQVRLTLRLMIVE